MKKNLTLILLFLQLAAGAQTPPYVPVAGLMGWWPFNNNAVDESTNSNDGTVSGPLITTNVTGAANSAYLFDGANDGITIPSLIMGTNEMSISVWVHPTDFSHTYHEIIRQDNGYTGAPDFLLSFQNSGSLLAFGVGTTTSYSELDINISPSGFLNNWTHIVVVYNGTQRFVYRNTVLIGSGAKTGNINYSASTFTVGCEPTHSVSHEFFKGKIDDIGIWNRALTKQEIFALYNGGLATGFNENNEQQDVIFYPNPTAGPLFVNANEEDAFLEIFSSLGAKVTESVLVPGGNTIDLNGLSAGIYFVKIYNEKKEVIKIGKIIRRN